MNVSSTAEEAISVFDLHHQFRIDYPVLQILDVNEEGWILQANDHEMGTRYYPHPLVENAEVIANTHYDWKDRYEYSAVSRAHPGNAENFRPHEAIPTAARVPPGPFFAERVDKLRFAADMAALEKCTGTTDLDVVLVVVRNGASEIKIRRKSYLRGANKKLRKNEAMYRMRMQEDFQTMLGTGAWHSQILELVHGSSDRAVRLETLMAGDWHQIIPQPGKFREPRRRPRMARAIALVTGQVDPLNLRVGDNESCATCWREWREIACPILRTDCCRNLFCSDCLLQDSTHHGLNYLCPMCRQGFFDQHAVKQVAFGLDRQGNYQRDDRFSDWENHERSFADLDEERPDVAGPGGDKIHLNSEIIYSAWLYVRNHARSEPQSSTPTYQNPVWFPEFSIVEKALKQVISSLSGRHEGSRLSVAPWFLYRALIANIREQFYREYLNSPVSTSKTERGCELVRLEAVFGSS
ncbi:hypothetical protein AC578_4473 [Pseudocercospora eumusae]|uniref:RING-type domain-containing protein n=1 Tax=Pseudocercospora eumusae TaxID=321146 RepID=A0A139HBR9_9PEZI|nr:hypothetical protein AC578_4473 [Pseudocercospora eumusae]